MDGLSDKRVSIEACSAAPRGRVAEPVAGATMPSWMRRLGGFAAATAMLSAAMLAASLAEFTEGSAMRPFALFFLTLAFFFGLTALVARQVHAALAGRVDLLSQALEASPNAHLILRPDGRLPSLLPRARGAAARRPRAALCRKRRCRQ